MDSSFNPGSGRDQQPPLFQQNPAAANAYRVNVNRTKTRKWVEAKAQSYDGDDWGASEDFDDDEESQQHIPMPRLGAPRLGAGAAPPSSGLEYGMSPSPPVNSPPQAQEHVSATPACLSETANSTLTNITGNQNTPNRRDTASPPSTSPITHLIQGQEQERGLGPASISPLKTDDEAISVTGLTEPNKQNPSAEAGLGMVVRTEGTRDLRRDSNSPQLPDVTRVSAFGIDLLSSTVRDLSIKHTIPGRDTQSLSPMLPSKTQREWRGNEMPVYAEEVPTHSSSDTRELAVQASDLPPPSAPSDQPQLTTRHFLNDPSVVPQDVLCDQSERPGSSSQDRRSLVASNGRMDTGAQDLKVPKSREVPSDAVAGGMNYTHVRRSILQPGREQSPIEPLRTPSPCPPSNVAMERVETQAESPTILEERQLNFGTESSSPTKENDVLGDEIMRSLTPRGISSFEEAPKSLAAGSPVAIKEHRHSDMHRDSRAALDEPNSSTSDTPALSEKASAGPALKASDSTDLDHVDQVDSRRRFSWEADCGQVVSSPSSRQSTCTTDPYVQPQPVFAPPAPGTTGMGPGLDIESWNSEHRAPGEIGSLQEQAPPAVTEPHPPLCEQPMSADSDSMKLSSTNEKAPASTSPGLSPPQPVEAHTTITDQPPASRAAPLTPGQAAPQLRVMAFQEIMALSNSSERVAKLDETRAHFALVDSGLSTWLVNIQSQRPEYASLTGASPRSPAQATSSPSSAGAQPSMQQPYYQQYLNASAPNPSQAGRSRLCGLQIPQQATGSTFGHPSNHLGIRSKEFMHSAGKMGKGLLSKGKSKLRGSGDKVFH